MLMNTPLLDGLANAVGNRVLALMIPFRILNTTGPGRGRVLDCVLLDYSEHNLAELLDSMLIVWTCT